MKQWNECFFFTSSFFPLCILELVLQARLQTAAGHRHKNRWDRIEINIPSVLLIFTPDWASEQCCGVTLFLNEWRMGFWWAACVTPRGNNLFECLLLKTLAAMCWIVCFPLNPHHLIYFLLPHTHTHTRLVYFLPTFFTLLPTYLHPSVFFLFSFSHRHSSTCRHTPSSPCEDTLIFWFLTFIRLSQTVIVTDLKLLMFIL